MKGLSAPRWAERLRESLTLPYAILVVLGAGAAVAVACSATWLERPPSSDWRDAMNQCLVVAGLLLVPASIYPAVVGAMFPRYWNATPQTVVAHHPIGSVLGGLALILGYSLAGLTLAPTDVLVLPLIFAVGIVALMALRAVAFSLALLDPIRFMQMLRNLSVNDSSEGLVREAHGDLCRFIRGLVDEQRRDSVRRGLSYLQEIWSTRAAKLRAEPRAEKLALDTLDKARRAWPTGDVADAAESCRRAIQGRQASA